MWYSQANQDKWVVDMLNERGLETGFFVDLGAYDGIQTSNTYSLEKDHGWRGICVEANPDYFSALATNRPLARNVHAAVSPVAGIVRFSGQLITQDLSAPEVEAMTLGDILDRCQAPEVIDYMSMDIEGMELGVLRAFDFQERTINLITVEHNLYCDGPENKDALFDLLTLNGFVRVIEDAPCLDPNPLYYMKPYEDWYANAAFLDL